MIGLCCALSIIASPSFSMHAYTYAHTLTQYTRTHAPIHTEEVLSVPAVNRNDKHDLTLELVLTVFRNVLSVQNAAAVDSSSADDRTFIHEQILLKFHSELVRSNPHLNPIFDDHLSHVSAQILDKLHTVQTSNHEGARHAVGVVDIARPSNLRAVEPVVAGAVLPHLQRALPRFSFSGNAAWLCGVLGGLFSLILGYAISFVLVLYALG